MLAVEDASHAKDPKAYFSKKRSSPLGIFSCRSGAPRRAKRGCRRGRATRGCRAESSSIATGWAHSSRLATRLLAISWQTSRKSWCKIADSNFGSV